MRAEPSLRGASGFSLIELMISITVGLLILAALLGVFLQGSKARSQNDRISRQIESGRYAMQLLGREIQQAGYFAHFNPSLETGVGLPTPATKPNACETGLAGLTAALPLHVQGYDEGVDAPGCLSDVRSGSDILVIRRVSNCVPGSADCDAAVNGDYLFQASQCDAPSELGAVPAVHFRLTNVAGAATLRKRNCTTLADVQRYLVRIYFVANNNKPGDGVPTLKRAELGSGGFRIVPLVDGIETLQLQHGLDLNTPRSGAPSVFTADPDAYAACSAVTVPRCTDYWRAVVAIHVQLLARNIEATPGYSDTKTYTLGQKADGTARVVGPFNDGYARQVHQAVSRLHNPSGRSATQ